VVRCCEPGKAGQPCLRRGTNQESLPRKGNGRDNELEDVRQLEPQLRQGALREFQNYGKEWVEANWQAVTIMCVRVPQGANLVAGWMGKASIGEEDGSRATTHF
jgi:hypothetical protein